METKQKRELVSVVLSFRNEEENLPELIRRLCDVFARIGIAYELLFVNDDSDDKSLEILLEHARREPRIKILNMSRRWGAYPCIVAGFRHAKGDAVIYMDSDLQDPPEVIPEMIEKWRNGAEAVNTVRTKRLGEKRLKMWLTKLACRTISFFADFELPGNSGDFKLLSRRIIDIVNTFDEHVHFMKGMTRWVGFKQETVFYVREARHSGKTHYPLFSSRSGPLRAFVDGIVGFSSLPLYFSLILGIGVSFCSFWYLVYVIISVLRGMRFQALLITNMIMLTLFGMVLLMIGVLGLYIEKIFAHTRGRPMYIVKDFICFDREHSDISKQ